MLSTVSPLALTVVAVPVVPFKIPVTFRALPSTSLSLDSTPLAAFTVRMASSFTVPTSGVSTGASLVPVMVMVRVLVWLTVPSVAV
ncbi:hypothetical protein D3C78_1280570 [compost metagenome]